MGNLQIIQKMYHEFLYILDTTSAFSAIEYAYKVQILFALEFGCVYFTQSFQKDYADSPKNYIVFSPNEYIYLV